jgi:DNA-binding response OmpR family regulator
MSRHVLLVEDDPAITGEVTALLRAEQFHVTVAETAARAVELLHHEHFDALVLDLVLTDGDAFPILDVLRATDKTMPVVIATQYLPLYIREVTRFFTQVKLIVPKPYPAAALVATVSALTEQAT